ncbi:MAG: hypothetical protein ACRCUT_03665 [Spirochaetota bacterium]
MEKKQTVPFDVLWNHTCEFPDIHLASVLSLKRNMSSLPFGSKMTDKDLQILKETIFPYAERFFPGKSLFILDQCSDDDILFYNEEQCCPDGCGPRFSSLLSDGEGNSIFLGGDSHCTISSVTAHSSFYSLYNQLDAADDRINELCGYAFDPSLGYLFENPSECGTGFTVRSLLHLPVLSVSNALEQIRCVCNDFDIECSGFLKKAALPVFILTSRPGTGESEQDLCGNMTKAISVLAGMERASRDDYYLHFKNSIDDAVWRSYGLLRYCRTVQWAEAAEYLLNIRFGIIMSVIPGLSLCGINPLFFSLMDSHIENIFSDKENREQNRASAVRTLLSKE